MPYRTRTTRWLLMTCVLLLFSGCGIGRSWFQMTSDSGPSFGLDLFLPQGRRSLLDDVSRTPTSDAQLQSLTFAEEPSPQPRRWTDWFTPGKASRSGTPPIALRRPEPTAAVVSPGLITPPVEQF